MAIPHSEARYEYRLAYQIIRWRAATGRLPFYFIPIRMFIEEAAMRSFVARYSIPTDAQADYVVINAPTGGESNYREVTD